MKLLIQQRLFSWLCSYDVYNEAGVPVYTVKGELDFGHCLRIYDQAGNSRGLVKERVLTFLPKFEIYSDEYYLGCISRELTFFTPKYHIDYNGWQVEGNLWEWDYSIVDSQGRPVATIAKEILNWTDTYTLTVYDPGNALLVLMLVLAIDAEKCSRD